MTKEVDAMLAAKTYAVVGASRDTQKYGSLVYRSLKAAGKTVLAVNPHADTVDNDPCYPTLDKLPTLPEVVVMVVPPPATESAVSDCIRLGIRHIWMQPGAESQTAIVSAQAAGITVISGGPCIMVLIRTQGFTTS